MPCAARQSGLGLRQVLAGRLGGGNMKNLTYQGNR